MDSTLPTPGTVCPRVALQTPLGPANTAVPFTTSRSVQPSMVFGRVSGVGLSTVRVRTSFTVAPVEALGRGATVESLLAGPAKGVLLTDFVAAAERFGF